MSYLAVLTFDLADATREDYDNAYSDVRDIGFSTTVRASSGKDIVLPTTTCVGEFNGADVGSVRDDLCTRVQRAFQTRGFKSEVFVAVGGDWAWGHRTT